MIKRYFSNPDVRATWLTLIGLLLLSLLQFNPLLRGKVLPMGDVVNATGMQRDVVEYREKTGQEPYWAENMFGGMPTETIGTDYSGNLMESLAQLVSPSFLPFPIAFFFLGMAFFYGLLRVWKVNHLLAAAGGIAYAFFSYHIMWIEAGHTNKFLALMVAPGVLLSISLLFRGKLALGFALTFLTLGLQLYFNHVQMTYYLAMVAGCYVVYELITAQKEGRLKQAGLQVAVLAVAAGMALMLNAVPIYPLYKYSQFTIRGKNELKVNLGQGGAGDGGLDRDSYAYNWSQGRLETLSLVIPNIQGGGNGYLPEDGKTLEALVQHRNELPGPPEQFIPQLRSLSYWGDQPFLSGPIYIGAVLAFLALVGMILVRSRLKFALAYAILLGLLLAMGKHSFSVPEALLILAMPAVYLFTVDKVKLDRTLYGVLLMAGALVVVLGITSNPAGYRFSDLFYDYLPLYNKFRVPSSMLVIVSLATPWLAMLGAQALLSDEAGSEAKTKAVLWAGGLVGGVSLLFWVMGPSLFDFVSAQDEQVLSSGLPKWLMDAIQADRAEMLQADAIRTVLFVLAATVVCLLYTKELVKSTAAVSVLLLALILTDLWGVDNRMLNAKTYQRKTEYAQNFQPRQADQLIRQDTTRYRVFAPTRNPFNDGFTPYFHKSIGGYNAAKLRRYQQLIEKHFTRGIGDPNVLNMLNTRYVISSQQLNLSQFAEVAKTNDGEYIYLNKTDYGNAWIVDKVMIVPTPDAALDSLGTVFSFETAIVEESQKSLLTEYSTDSLNRERERIQLLQSDNTYLKYAYKSDKARFVTFSEVYYPNGWTAMIDGKEAPIVQTNFVLRGLVVPAGEHTVEFRYAPESILVGEKISMVFSILLVLALAGAVYLEVKGRKPADAATA